MTRIPHLTMTNYYDDNDGGLNHPDLRKLLPDFRPLNKALPGKVRGSDIDFIIEVRGAVLILEFKGHENDIGIGQELMLNTLASHPNTWVLVIRYRRNPDDPSDLTDITQAQLLGQPPIRANLADVQTVLRLFHDWAVARPWQPSPTPNKAPWL